MKPKTSTISRVISAVALALSSVALFLPQVSQAALGPRSLVLTSSAPSAVTTHTVNLAPATTANIGSITFLYCTTSVGSCTTPAGLVTTSSVLASQSGATGFTLDNSTAGLLLLTRTAASITSGTALSYQFTGITNPSAINTTFYIRLATFTGTDGVTGPVDGTAAVAGSTAQQIFLSGTMPESLIFCVGTSGSDCTNITGSTVDFGIFSPIATNVGTSVMAASTNASSGYTITVSGNTLTSGTNTIPAMGVQSLGGATSASSVGVSQFGLNLVTNTTPTVGLAESGAGTATPVADYGTSNGFRFFTGDPLAGSAGPTQSNTYTSAYIVNVSGIQAAGLYATTLTYVCTGQF